MAIHAPKRSAKFKKYWNIFIKDVENRDNFKPTHVKQLEVLVDLLIEYDELTEFIRKNGYSFEASTQFGTGYKKYPEVDMRQKTITNIREYCKMLDITLTKDAVVKADPEADKWE